jgi:hypothetical protein
MAEIFESPPTQKERYKPLERAKLLDHDERSIRIGTGSATVEVTALTPNLFRVGMFHTPPVSQIVNQFPK